MDSSTIFTSTKCPSRLMNSCAKVTSVETLASSFSESHRTPESELWMPLYKSSAQRPCGGTHKIKLLAAHAADRA